MVWSSVDPCAIFSDELKKLYQQYFTFSLHITYIDECTNRFGNILVNIMKNGAFAVVVAAAADVLFN